MVIDFDRVVIGMDTSYHARTSARSSRGVISDGAIE